MKLDSTKFKEDKSRSNPMVVAMRYYDCPINEICIFVAVGFGSSVRQCEYFEDKEDSAYCLYDEVDKPNDLSGVSPNE